MRGRTSHFTQRANRSMPPATVIPVLEYRDVIEAARWLCSSFGFAERLRIGDHRIQLSVGSGSVVIAMGSSARPVSHSIMVRIANTDEHFACSSGHGARVLSAPCSFPYGERQYTVVDIGGHAWTFSQTEADVDPASWGGKLEEKNEEFATQWADAWNRRAVEEILEGFHEDIVFTSPTALAVVGSSVVRGKDALRAYWIKALAGIGSLRFSVDRALWDPAGRELAIIYSAEIDGRTRRVSENLTFNEEGKVVAAEVFHGALA